jgi:hypothetical protein
VHLEWDANTQHTELRYVLALEGEALLPLALHVQAAGGIAGAFTRTLDVSAENLLTQGEVEHATQLWQHSAATARGLAPHLAPLVSLTLYLCAQAAELHDAQGQRRRPTRPQPTKTKHGVRLFPPAQPTTWDVAYRLGAARGGRSRWPRSTRSRPRCQRPTSPPGTRHARICGERTGIRTGSARVAVAIRARRTPKCAGCRRFRWGCRRN